ncbi:unnamed protein product [Cylindrotheca closterium]|uniref:Uncharacterized protein n=1 Tax=Cylindrotheca closterium TaxID=2856 RepID=A0AAD2FPQ2_9STRA|nr:unnamed protein product [Cylindrotheca closterium]
MKFHLITSLVALEILNLIPYCHALWVQSLKNPQSASSTAGGAGMAALPRLLSLTPSASRTSVSRYSSSLRPRSPFSSSSALYADKNDSRIFKAGGGVPQTPSGELRLFDPGEQGMKGGTLDLAERLKKGVSYHKAKESENGNQNSPQVKHEFSLFDPAKEGMRGGSASDFAERLDGGANFQPEQEQQAIEQPKMEVPQTNGAVSSPPKPVVTAAKATTTSTKVSAPARQEAAAANGRRASWPFQPLLSSSTPAYPNVGVGRGRAAAIRKQNQERINKNSSVVRPNTTTVVPTSRPASNYAPVGYSPAATVINATPKATVVPNGSAVVADTKSKKQERKKVATDNHFWGKQSNWWDNPSGARFGQQ